MLQHKQKFCVLILMPPTPVGGQYEDLAQGQEMVLATTNWLELCKEYPEKAVVRYIGRKKCLLPKHAKPYDIAYVKVVSPENRFYKNVQRLFEYARFEYAQ